AGVGVQSRDDLARSAASACVRGKHVLERGGRVRRRACEGFLYNRRDAQERQTPFQESRHGDLVGRVERGRRGSPAPERCVGKAERRKTLEIGLLEAQNADSEKVERRNAGV